MSVNISRDRNIDELAKVHYESIIKSKVISSLIIFVVESQHLTVKNKKQLAKFRSKSLKSYHFKHWKKQIRTFKKLRE